MNNNTLVFHNPGELDIRLLSTFGASVKVGDSPIGQFGTGLKMALAATLRLGGSVRIRTGGAEYNVETQRETIRGKDFDVVHLVGRDSLSLGFTTELAQHWEPWMALREFWSNAKDEGGGMRVDGMQLIPHDTEIIVSCDEISDAAEHMDDYFIDERAQRYTAGEVQILPRRAAAIYYRGIRVWKKFGDHNHTFSYNITSPLALTEDRTLRDVYSVRHLIAKAWRTVGDAEYCEAHAGIDSSTFEAQLDYDWSEPELSSEFFEAWFRRWTGKHSVPTSIRAALRKHDSERMEQAQSVAIPATFSELEAMAPQAHEVDHKQAYSASSNALYDFHKASKALEAQLKFWRNAAKALMAQASEMPKAESDEDGSDVII